MFGKPEGYPDTMHIDEMKDKIGRMKINTLGGFLEDIAHCRIPLKLIIDNEPLVERFIGKKRRRDEDEVYEFVRWLKKRYAKPSLEELETDDDQAKEGLKLARETVLEAPLWPSEGLFAEYVGVDLQKIEEEKKAVLAFIKEKNEEMLQAQGQMPAPPEFDPEGAS